MPNPKEESSLAKIRSDLTHAEATAKEKLALSERGVKLVSSVTPNHHSSLLKELLHPRRFVLTLLDATHSLRGISTGSHPSSSCSRQMCRHCQHSQVSHHPTLTQTIPVRTTIGGYLMWPHHRVPGRSMLNTRVSALSRGPLGDAVAKPARCWHLAVSQCLLPAADLTSATY